MIHLFRRVCVVDELEPCCSDPTTLVLLFWSADDPVGKIEKLGQPVYDFWESCKNAFSGKLTRAGTIPFQGWAAIKRPYKSLVHELLSSPAHVILCGRQGVDYGEDEATGELKALGYRMKAEGETPYEPDVLIRMEAKRTAKKAVAVTTAHVEKDRTGVLAGRSIPWPTFANIA